MPKGSLSREQFSQLLLVYISIAADIVEIFEAFRESRVMLNQNLTYVVLAVWTWSLLQFCVVLRGTHRGRKARISSLYPGGGEYQRLTEAKHNRPIPKFIDNRPLASASEVFGETISLIIYFKNP